MNSNSSASLFRAVCICGPGMARPWPHTTSSGRSSRKRCTESAALIQSGVKGWRLQEDGGERFLVGGQEGITGDQGLVAFAPGVLGQRVVECQQGCWALPNKVAGPPGFELGSALVPGSVKSLILG